MSIFTKIYGVIPGLVALVVVLLGQVVFAVRIARHGWPELPPSKRKGSFLASHFIMQYLFWLVGPVENTLVRFRVSPTAISFSSLGACVGAGLAAALNHFALACWLYVLSGVLDTLDGRVARRTGTSSAAGAFLDSVLDRWAEFIVLGGLIIGAQTTFARFAVMACIVGSQMVSYTRARGEGLGVVLDGGLMQRAERLGLIALTLLVAAVGRESGWYDEWLVLSWGALGVGLVSTFSAAGRLRAGLSALSKPRVESVAATAPAERRDPPGRGADLTLGEKPA
jgi:CDP-diacylglycerol--glycerol-3-phosphate 3-phosphatidyltransferase